MSTTGLNLHLSTTRIVVDNAVQEQHAVSNWAHLLAQELRAKELNRIALCTPRVDRLISALCACEQAGTELLLLRRIPEDDATLAAWGVEAILDEDFSLTSTGIKASETSGFAVVLTTSGTTGIPKVASHSPERLIGKVRRPNSGYSPPVWLLTYHPASFAGLQVTLTSLLAAGTLLSCQSLDVSSLAATALEHGATHISGTPTFFRAFLMTLGSEASRLPLRQITLGGESVDQAILDRIRAIYPQAGITHIYASTEAGSLFAVRDGQAGFPSSWLEGPVDGVALRINGDMLEVQSPRAMRGYLKGTESSPLTDDGWLITNDRVTKHEDRVLFLGRKDSIINVGGANVSPEAVEAVILKTEGVTDVRVSGVSNPISGQIVSVEIVPETGRDPDELRRSVLSLARRELESYQVPRIVRMVSSIEYSETGKKKRK